MRLTVKDLTKTPKRAARYDAYIRGLLQDAEAIPFDDFRLAFGLFAGDRLVGGVRHGIQPPEIAYDYEIAIAPEARNGVGGYLLTEAAIAHARRSGYPCIAAMIVNEVYFNMLVKFFGFTDLGPEDNPERWPFYRKVFLSLQEQKVAPTMASVANWHRDKAAELRMEARKHEEMAFRLGAGLV